MIEESWTYGVDLWMEDNLLDPVTIGQLIDAVRCNVKDVTKEAVRKELNNILEIRKQDMEIILNNSIDEIIKDVICDKPLRMSFYDGTLIRSIAEDVMSKTEKGFIYTYGFGLKHPSTYRKPITKERALEILKNECFLDITEEDEVFHLNAYSDNDMF